MKKLLQIIPVPSNHLIIAVHTYGTPSENKIVRSEVPTIGLYEDDDFGDGEVFRYAEPIYLDSDGIMEECSGGGFLGLEINEEADNSRWLKRCEQFWATQKRIAKRKEEEEKKDK